MTWRLTGPDEDPRIWRASFAELLSWQQPAWLVRSDDISLTQTMRRTGGTSAAMIDSSSSSSTSDWSITRKLG